MGVGRKNVNIFFNQVFESAFNKDFNRCGTLSEISHEIYKLASFATKCGFSNISLLPIFHICNFMTTFTFVIAPEGDIYKCEELVGKKEFSIGNVKTGIVPLEILKYFYHNPYDKPFLYKKCQRCKILPYCNGFCPIAKFLNIESERCHHIKYIFSKMLRLFIDTKYVKKI